MRFGNRFAGALLASAVALLIPVMAPAQQATEDATGPAAQPAASEDRVVVRGRRELEDTARAFVGEAADQISRNFGLARWQNRVCVGVQNIQIDAAQYIADRISEVALDVGLEPGEPGCRPDIQIVFSTDGPALAAHLVKEERRMFRPYGGVGGVQQGLQAMDEFTLSDAPVRWWQISMPMTRDGQIAIALPGREPPVIGGANSRIRRSIHDELWSSIIIVDATKLDGVNWGQLADYLAMIALAQIDPQGETAAFDSILNLFAERNPAGGLTDWDIAYLRGLYVFNQEWGTELHRGVLADAIAEEMQAMQQEYLE